MVTAVPSQRNLRFGPYLADLSTGELWRDGVRVSLQDKPFQILALLLQHPGELVTREDLRSRLWPADTFVDFEHGLNTAVKKLRQALDDSAEEPRYVETLPRRGYRFLAPVAGNGAVLETAVSATTPAMPETAAPGGAPSAGTRWWVHVAWLGLAVLAAAAAWRARGSERTPAPPANPVPVIVLMDSPLPGRVYDPRTLAAGGTNADDLTDALRDLAVVIEKENTSPMWHREQQVLQQKPDLIVSHLSCLYDERVAPPDDAVQRQFFNLAVDRLLSFFAYVAQANPRTRFLVYSRGRFEGYGGPEKFRADTQARFPVLAGRLHPWTVPGDPQKVTFRDPALGRLIRDRVQAILGPP